MSNLQPIFSNSNISEKFKIKIFNSNNVKVLGNIFYLIQLKSCFMTLEKMTILNFFVHNLFIFAHKLTHRSSVTWRRCYLHVHQLFSLWLLENPKVNQVRNPNFEIIVFTKTRNFQYRYVMQFCRGSNFCKNLKFIPKFYTPAPRCMTIYLYFYFLSETPPL